MQIPSLEHLPKAFSELFDKVNSIEQLLRSEGQKEPIEQDRLFTIQETADFLSLAVPTIYGLVSRNEIPYSKKGKRLYFSRLELMDWVKSGRSKTRAEIAAEADDYLAKRKRG